MKSPGLILEEDRHLVDFALKYLEFVLVAKLQVIHSDEKNRSWNAEKKNRRKTRQIKSLLGIIFTKI